MRRDPGTVLDEWLVASAKTGGEVAFGQLVGRWTPRLLRHASRLLGDIDQAQDVVQDAWVGAARGLRRLEDPARFPAWMFALVSRRCTDRVRRNVRDRRLAAQVADLRGPPAEADGADQRLDLRHAIAELPVEQRLVVSLHYGEGFGIDEIAAAHGLPSGTVKSRLFAARQTLKAYLQGDDHDDHR
jgi:RNA polymerase sigma-70 factor (ECF subfamily)